MSRTRKSVSVKGLTYFRLQRWAKEKGVGVGSIVDKWAMEELLKKRPKQPHVLFEVRSSQEPDATVLYVVAPTADKAASWAEMDLKVEPTSMHVIPSRRLYDPDKITYAHIGVVTQTEIADLC